MESSEQALAIWSVLSDVYDKSPWSLSQISEDLKKDSTDYFFVYNDGEVIGFLALQQLVGEVEITNIAVKKNYQGKGYAYQLMSMIADIEVPVFLEVRYSNIVAQKLYERCGFVVLRKRKNYYHDPIEDAIVMRKG